MKKLLYILLGLALGAPLFVSALSIYTVPQGGTGWGNIQANTVLLGNGTGAIATTSQAANGTVLTLVGGVPTFSLSALLGTSSPWTTGQLVYVVNNNTVTSVATTTASCAGGTTCTAFTIVGSSPVTITGTSGTVTAVNGTANQITSSGGTTPTLSLPSLVVFPGQASSTQESSTQAYFGGTATTTISSLGIGIGTSTPFAALSLDRQRGFASSTIAVNEYSYGTATSTADTIDCRSASQTHFRMGAAAVTLTLNSDSMIPGQTCRVIVENPNGTAGALTWAVSAGAILKWAGGTTPTQTTTANSMDVYSFVATTGSTTKAILGAASTGF